MENNKYIEYFNKFLYQLNIFFSSDREVEEEIKQILAENNETKIARGQCFINSLTDDEHFNGFINSKIKIFSHKDEITKSISISLLGEKLNIKKILNHQTEDIKNIVWVYLHVLYYNMEICKEDKNEIRIKQLETLINKNSNEKSNFLNLNVNNNTNSLINDIISSFEDSLKTSDNLSNHFNNILNISQTISDKYSDDIVNGNIEFDKLLGSITNKLPGMENLMKNFGSMNLNPNKQSSVNEEKVIIDENFSTAIVQVGENNDEKKSDFKISNILKMADKFGFIPNKQSETNDVDVNKIDNVDLTNVLGKDFDISKLSDILQKMYTAKSPDEADEIKDEMNSFLINDIGIDFNKLAQQLNDINIDPSIASDSKVSEVVNDIINKNDENGES